MKNNQVVKIGQFSDHDLARLALRERLSSMLQFGRLSVKAGEEKPRYDVKHREGKGVITRADGTVVFEASLPGLVESGKQVRLALVGYNRLLRERGILEYVRDNRDLQKVVNVYGNEIVLLGFDSRSKKVVQRYKLVRNIVLGDLGLTVTALPKKLSDAVELGQKVEENFLQQLEAAKQAGDVSKVTSLEELGAQLGIFKKSAVYAPKAKPATPPSAAAPKAGGQPPQTKSEAPTSETKKKKRRRRPRNRKPKAQ